MSGALVFVLLLIPFIVCVAIQLFMNYDYEASCTYVEYCNGVTNAAKPAKHDIVEEESSEASRRTHSSLLAEEARVPIDIMKEALAVEGRDEAAKPKAVSAAQLIWSSRGLTREESKAQSERHTAESNGQERDTGALSTSTWPLSDGQDLREREGKRESELKIESEEKSNHELRQQRQLKAGTLSTAQTSRDCSCYAWFKRKRGRWTGAAEELKAGLLMIELTIAIDCWLDMIAGQVDESGEGHMIAGYTDGADDTSKVSSLLKELEQLKEHMVRTGLRINFADAWTRCFPCSRLLPEDQVSVLVVKLAPFWDSHRHSEMDTPTADRAQGAASEDRAIPELMTPPGAMIDSVESMMSEEVETVPDAYMVTSTANSSLNSTAFSGGTLPAGAGSGIGMDELQQPADSSAAQQEGADAEVAASGSSTTPRVGVGPQSEPSSLVLERLAHIGVLSHQVPITLG